MNDKKIKTTIELLLAEKRIKDEILRQLSNECSACGKRAIKYTQARLEKVQEKLSTMGARAIRIASERISNS